MNKYLNIIIISFLRLTLALKNVGYVFFIPIAFFFSYLNPKNIFLIIASSLLAVLWFDPNKVPSLLIVLALLAAYIFIYKEKQYVINLIFILGLNLLSLFFYYKVITILLSFFSVLSVSRFIPILPII